MRKGMIKRNICFKNSVFLSRMKRTVNTVRRHGAIPGVCHNATPEEKPRRIIAPGFRVSVMINNDNIRMPHRRLATWMSKKEYHKTSRGGRNTSAAAAKYPAAGRIFFDRRVVNSAHRKEKATPTEKKTVNDMPKILKRTAAI